MPDLPGWNSLEAVARYHRWAEITGIVVLALLVIAELASYRYGQRKDDLTTKQQEATDKRHDEEMARLHLETAQANEQAAKAQLALEKMRAPRTLGPARQKAVANAVRPFSGQRYTAAVSQGADDGIALWESLHATLEKAGWIYVPMGPNDPGVGNPRAGIPIAAAPGIEILVDPANESDLRAAALALGNALHADGTVVAVNRDQKSGQTDRDVLLIRIGARIPPE